MSHGLKVLRRDGVEKDGTLHAAIKAVWDLFFPALCSLAVRAVHSCPHIIEGWGSQQCESVVKCLSKPIYCG